MINDWTGNRFVYERPFGVENLQLSEGYAYNAAEEERDTEHGYPSAYKSNKELTETVGDWIQGTGAFRNQFDVKAEEEYKLEKHLDETSKKPAFKVRSDMINDWTGTKFVNERPYGAVNVQLEGKPVKKEYKVEWPKVEKKKNWISIEDEEKLKAEEKEKDIEARIKASEKGLPPCPRCATKVAKEDDKIEIPKLKSKASPPDWAVNPTAK